MPTSLSAHERCSPDVFQSRLEVQVLHLLICFQSSEVSAGHLGPAAIEMRMIETVEVTGTPTETLVSEKKSYLVVPK